MNKIAYFDNAATTFPKPEDVYSFMNSFYRACGVNVGRGQHKMASRANALVEETRKLLLDLNHCSNRRVVFTPSATEALNIVIRGSMLQGNANIYISPFEHNAATRAIEYLSRCLKLNVITLAFDKKCFKYDLDGIKNQFQGNKPSMVVVSHASNVCGLIAPIDEIFALSKPYRATNIVDMAQTMGLVDTNLNNDNIDYAVFAAHKTLYGALGLGGFICKADARPEPLIYGGTGVDSANPSMPDTLPERYEAGSPNIAAIAALNASLKWLGKIGIRIIGDTERENHIRLLSILKKYANIQLTSPSNPDNNVGVVSCLFDGYGSDNIGQILSDHNIAVRTGLHCSPSAHRFLGTFPAGTVRFSVSFFNDDDDFNQLDKVFKYIEDNS
jgi:cysteine desulfurase family protein